MILDRIMGGSGGSSWRGDISTESGFGVGEGWGGGLPCKLFGSAGVLEASSGVLSTASVILVKSNGSVPFKFPSIVYLFCRFNFSDSPRFCRDLTGLFPSGLWPFGKVLFLFLSLKPLVWVKLLVWVTFLCLGVVFWVLCCSEKLPVHRLVWLGSERGYLEHGRMNLHVLPLSSRSIFLVGICCSLWRLHCVHFPCSLGTRHLQCSLHVLRLCRS